MTRNAYERQTKCASVGLNRLTVHHLLNLVQNFRADLLVFEEAYLSFTGINDRVVNFKLAVSQRHSQRRKIVAHLASSLSLTTRLKR